MSWIDSLHTGGAILVSESNPVPEGGGAATISAFGTYFAGAGQPRWGWRTELDDQTESALRIRGMLRETVPACCQRPLVASSLQSTGAFAF